MKNKSLLVSALVIGIIIIVAGPLGVILLLGVPEESSPTTPTNQDLLTQLLLIQAAQQNSVAVDMPDTEPEPPASTGETVAFNGNEPETSDTLSSGYSTNDRLIDLRRINLFGIDLSSLNKEECDLVSRRVKDDIRDQENQVDDARDRRSRDRNAVDAARQMLQQAQDQGDSARANEAERALQNAEDDLDESENDLDKEEDILSDLEDLQKDINRIC